MNTLAANEEARAVSVSFEAERFTVELSDGRAVSIPYAWFPRLANASHDDRSEYELIGRGFGIHWPRLDEDLSVPGLLGGLAR